MTFGGSFPRHLPFIDSFRLTILIPRVAINLFLHIRCTQKYTKSFFCSTPVCSPFNITTPNKTRAVSRRTAFAHATPKRFLFCLFSSASSTWCTFAFAPRVFIQAFYQPFFSFSARRRNCNFWPKYRNCKVIILSGRDLQPSSSPLIIYFCNLQPSYWP